jgi:hypothetical protein
MLWRTPVDGSGETSIVDGHCDSKGAVRAPPSATGGSGIHLFCLRKLAWRCLIAKKASCLQLESQACSVSVKGMKPGAVVAKG